LKEAHVATTKAKKTAKTGAKKVTEASARPKAAAKTIKKPKYRVFKDGVHIGYVGPERVYTCPGDCNKLHVLQDAPLELTIQV
jgi:hypothetical protein